MFVNNTVTYLRDIKERVIDDLLFQTQKSIKYNGRDSYKFYIWRPAQLNERIARQDSIFLCGIEKFRIDEHPVIILPIPFAWKKSIQYTLKSLFGISAETLFADVTGYAISNDKFSPHKINSSYFNIEKFDVFNDMQTNRFDSFQRGISCLVNKKYALAIKYLCKFETLNYRILENFSYKTNTDEQLFYIEHHYSKALCYHHLNENILALNSYRVIFNLCYKLLKQYGDFEDFSIKQFAKSSNERKVYINNKFYKILEDYIDILFQEKLYDEAIFSLEKIKPQNESNMAMLIQTALNEMYLLDSLYNLKKYTYKKIKHPQIKNNYLLYCDLLNTFFEYSRELLIEQEQSPIEEWHNNVEDLMTNIIDKIKICIEKGEEKLFYLWHIGDILEALKISKINDNKKQYMRIWLSKLTECQKYINETVFIEQYDI